MVDARNLRRMLSFTLQLLEAGLPLILVLNMMDEAEERGIEIDISKLSRLLEIPVVGTISREGKGIEKLKTEISEFTPGDNTQKFRQKLDYGTEIEPYIKAIEGFLGPAKEAAKEAAISKRAISLLLLQKDRTALEYLHTAEKTPEYWEEGHDGPEVAHIIFNRSTCKGYAVIGFQSPGCFCLFSFRVFDVLGFVKYHSGPGNTF